MIPEVPLLEPYQLKLVYFIASICEGPQHFGKVINMALSSLPLLQDLPRFAPTHFIVSISKIP